MIRHKQTEAIEEARLYIRNYVYDTENTFDATSIHRHKSRLEKVRADCIRSINYGNGKISAVRIGPAGRYERFDAADARIVAKYIKKRLTEVKRIIAEAPVETPRQYHDVDEYYQSGKARHAMIFVQRAVKRKQRMKAKGSSRCTPSQQVLPEHDELLELELLFKDRVPHRNGWGRLYRPTRATWYRHSDNRCWKNKKCQKQWMKE